MATKEKGPLGWHLRGLQFGKSSIHLTAKTLVRFSLNRKCAGAVSFLKGDRNGIPTIRI